MRGWRSESFVPALTSVLELGLALGTDEGLMLL